MRYVTALREGGSVPAVVEADDGALYVAKFRGAAQGERALAAELIVGQLARAAGLPVPELVLIDVEAALGRSEPHQEIREQLIASAGMNLGMAYLPGSIGYDAAARAPISGELASRIVAFDVFSANVDRTARNPNLLWWRGGLWLIDHGAALYWHHGYEGQRPSGSGADGAVNKRAEAGPALADAATDDADAGTREDNAELVCSAERPFVRVGEHVLLPFADRLPEAGEALATTLDDGALAAAIAALPDAWIHGIPVDRMRSAYRTWLRARRAALPRLIEEAIRVRAAAAV